MYVVRVSKSLRLLQRGLLKTTCAVKKIEEIKNTLHIAFAPFLLFPFFDELNIAAAVFSV